MKRILSLALVLVMVLSMVPATVFAAEATPALPTAKVSEIKKDDLYLLCSDGLTDMLTNFEICDIMLQSEDAESCVNNLIHAALEHGGRDNITAIVCRLI